MVNEITTKIKQQMDDCPECAGKNKILMSNYNRHLNKEIPTGAVNIITCLKCNGTGKEPLNVEDKTMEIIGHLVDAGREIKNNRYAVWNDLYNGKEKEEYDASYEMLVLNTYEHHLSSAFIGLVELCGADSANDINNYGDADQNIIDIINYITGECYFLGAVGIRLLCKTQNIDLEKYVLALLEYKNA